MRKSDQGRYLGRGDINDEEKSAVQRGGFSKEGWNELAGGEMYC